MPDTELFLIQYRLRSADVLSVRERFTQALNEDKLYNADMFDTTRRAFSQSLHPNKTMRELETELTHADTNLLCLLCALCDTGLELQLGLSDLKEPAAFLQMAASLFEEMKRSEPDARHLACHLTEIKAEHALHRLSLAISQLDRCDGGF